MVKFLHAADLHLDSPFSGLTPEQAALRRKEQRALPAKLSELARLHGCDFVLLAGDVFDGESVCPDSIEALQAAFAACPCPIFLAPGNHDPLTQSSPYRTERWSENVHIFSRNTISSVSLPGCRVFGAAFEQPYEQNLLADFSAPDDGTLNLMVLHGDAQTTASDYNAISKAQIAASNLHYLALGHIHQSSGLCRAGRTFYAWPGCAMGRGFDELGEKGAYLVTLTAEDCQLDFLPLAPRRYEILRVSPGDDALSAIAAALPGDTASDIYRILLTGEAEKPNLAALYDHFSPRFFSLTLRDETTPKRDLWQGAGEDTLRGLALSQLKAAYDAAETDATRHIAALAARDLLAAMEGREDL